MVSVSDGDTVTILEPGNRQTKIRLAQIDAPEKNQDYGQASKKSLSDLVYGKTVAVEVETIDKYGRTVGKVLADGADANLEQVRRGMAWVYRKYAYDSAYYAAEDSAKAARLGLWSMPDAMPPWEFRHGEKSSGEGLLAKHRAMATPTPRPMTNGVTAAGPCGSKRFCKEMASCEEAMHYLKNCGLDKLDRDGDGVPCEALCK